MSRLIYQRYWLQVAAIGFLGSLALYLYGVPYGVDVPQHYRMALGFFESIKAGDLYPSWLSSTNGGYGDPSIRFYPPALYYLLSFFRLITRDWYVASLLSLSLLTMVGGAGMYLWAGALTDKRYAVLAALVYILSPYHANEMYQAGLYAQYTCASALPFVFAFTERIIAKGRWRDTGGLAISYGFVVLSNLPLAVLGSVAVAVYALVRLAQSFSRRSLYQLIAGVLNGIAFSSCYLVPMLVELKWKRPSGAALDKWFDYKNNFIFQPSPNAMGNYWVPIITSGTLLLAVPAIVLFAKRKREAVAPAVVALVTFLMATALSKPIWDAITVLQETQFPWRMLTITSACLSILVAMSFPELVGMWRTRLRPVSLALFGITAVVLSFTILQIIRPALFRNHVAFNQMVTSLPGSESNEGLLPVWVPGKPRTMAQPVEAQGREIQVTEWSEKHRSFQLGAGAITEARLRTFYYPYWQATADGSRLATRPADDGALLVSVPQTATTVRVDFVEPTSTYVAGALSVLGLFGIALSFVVDLRQRKTATAV